VIHYRGEPPELVEEGDVAEEDEGVDVDEDDAPWPRRDVPGECAEGPLSEVVGGIDPIVPVDESGDGIAPGVPDCEPVPVPALPLG
jgi:hypothetical protein